MRNCKKNNLLLNNPVDAISVNNVTKLDNINPTVGRNEKILNIQQSLFANVLNYVTETIRICIANHSRSESWTNSCIPLKLSKFSFRQFLLTENDFLFLYPL